MISSGYHKPSNYSNLIHIYNLLTSEEKIIDTLKKLFTEFEVRQCFHNQGPDNVSKRCQEYSAGWFAGPAFPVIHEISLLMMCYVCESTGLFSLGINELNNSKIKK